MNPAAAVESIYAEPIGCYIVVKSREKKICRITFSEVSQGEASYNASCILDHLLGISGSLDLDLDPARLSAFQKEVAEVVTKIPRGKTLTYGTVAERINRPGASRAVGRALAANPFPVIIPCHRVVAKKGLGGYSGGTLLKEKLLALERKEGHLERSKGA